MYNIILILFLCIFTVSTYGETQQQKGEKKMATLIKQERWIGSTTAQVRANLVGWNGGLWGTATHLEIDPVLGNTIYSIWSTDSGGCPNGGCSTIQYAITAEQYRTGITIHSYLKSIGIMSGPMPTVHWHMGPRGNGYTMHGGNATGQFLLESAGQNGDRSPPGTLHTISQNSQGRWVAGRNDGIGLNNLYWRDLPAADRGRLLTAYLVDNVWYEYAWYWFPGNPVGSSNARTAVWLRRVGENNWTNVIEVTGDIVATVVGTPWFGIGPYIHGYTPSYGEKRQYYGPWDIWVGNAFEDGDLSGSGGGGGGGSTDTTGPVITDKVAITTATTATIGWTTDEDSNTVVDYGPTETRGTVVRGAESTRNHVVEITGLTPSTTYYYRFSSRDAAGNVTMDQANSTFTTKAVADTTRPVISGINVTAETTTANVTWTTDENSNSNVDYGTTTAYGKSVVGNADTQSHVVAIAGLTEGTTYNYRVRSADAEGNEAVSDNATFVTEKTPVTPVEVSLNDLTDVALATPVEGQVMMYRNGQWVNVDARPLVAQLVEEILGATSLVVNKPSA